MFTSTFRRVLLRFHDPNPRRTAALGDCTSACAGNANETCGGSNRLNVFNSNGPVPQIVQSVAGPANVGAWTYQGCFTDSVSARTLGVPVNVPVGVTPESCTAACMSLGNFVNAGVEVGRECWCDKTVNSPAQHVSDADCRQICDADHAEYCGNQNRLAVYHFSNSSDSNGSDNDGAQECMSTDLGAANNFALQGRFRNGAQQGQQVSLKVIAVEIAKGITWTILSRMAFCQFNQFDRLPAFKRCPRPINVFYRTPGWRITCICSKQPCVPWCAGMVYHGRFHRISRR
ncbi:hypothetical protein BDQ17DRAFT_1076220 [Cyathus striatus]|nr:hypothetical protein BDQ17DRAFT_1076220 [Cyathus striatus]